jgi:hypothetical protein
MCPPLGLTLFSETPPSEATANRARDVWIRLAGHQAWCPIQQFDNVDLYSLVAEILKIQPAKTDGLIAPLCSILMNPPASCTVPRSQP